MKITKELLSKVMTFPEHLYGVTLVTLKMRDGKEIHRAEVSWEGEILRIDGKAPAADLNVAEIVDVSAEG